MSAASMPRRLPKAEPVPRSLNCENRSMGRFLIGFAVFSSIMLASSNYEESIHAWQQQRDAGLRSPGGWLTLVGLFWLKAGDNTIGSADSNNFVLPKGSAPSRVGTFRVENGKVSFIRP